MRTLTISQANRARGAIHKVGRAEHVGKRGAKAGAHRCAGGLVLRVLLCLDLRLDLGGLSRFLLDAGARFGAGVCGALLVVGARGVGDRTDRLFLLVGGCNGRLRLHFGGFAGAGGGGFVAANLR